MGLLNGLKNIFVGDEILAAEEEYATYNYRPQQAEDSTAAKPDQTAFEIPSRESESTRESEPAKEKYRSPAREQYKPADADASAARNKQREAANRMRENDSYTSSYRKSGRDPERESGVRMSTTEESSFDLVLARPSTFKEVEKIGKDINCGRTVILNLELVTQELSTRILDFLWGVAFANDDKMELLANKTYAIIPQSVNFLSNVDLVSELENNGYSF